MKTIIHVNQHIIKSNRKFLAIGESASPPLTVKTYKENKAAHSVVIDGPSKVVYSPDKPLKCGATVWIETHGKVTCS